MSLFDELRLCCFFDENLVDLLGYFVLCCDKVVVFFCNGYVVVCYCMEVGVVLVLGDLVGLVDQWFGVIDVFFEVVYIYGWVFVVVGILEEGVMIWNQVGLRVMCIGDEVIIFLVMFNFDDFDFKLVCYMVMKLCVMGYMIWV